MKTIKKTHPMSFKEALIWRRNCLTTNEVSPSAHRDTTAQKFALEDGAALSMIHFTDVSSQGCLP